VTPLIHRRESTDVVGNAVPGGTVWYKVTGNHMKSSEGSQIDGVPSKV